MSITILNELDNKLLNRKEITARVTYEGATPNRDAVKNEMKLKGNVVIRKITPEFGKCSAIVEAVSYAKKEDMEKEAKHFLKKNVTEAPAEENKEEAATENAETKGEE